MWLPLRQFTITGYARVLVALAQCVGAAMPIFLIAPCAYGSDGVPTATLQANPDILMADGRSKSTITVTLDDGTGHTVADGTQVHFSTSSGTLDPSTTVSSGGVARTMLTSSPIAGNATVTASFISSSGGANGVVVVEFTTDPTLADTDQISSNWIRVTSSDYLAYGADSRIIDSAGRKQGVRIAYRGLEIDADSAQVDLDADTVRAQNATMRHGTNPPLFVNTLLYNLDSRTGTGIIADAPGLRSVEQVNINGSNLSTTVLKPSPSAAPIDYDFRDLSQGHVLVKASSVSVQPRVQIQLAHATVYLDAKKIVSMPNEVMPLSTDQVFGQQVLGYGSSGLFLDIPYYSSLSPSGTSLFSLRSQAAAVQAGTEYSGRSGLALDYDHSFMSANRQSDFKVMGLSSPGWGLSWTQSMRLQGGTQTYFYVDSPEHQSYFGSANVRHDFGSVTANVDLSQTKPLNTSTGTFGSDVNAGLQTPSHLLFGGKAHGLFYSEDAGYEVSNQNYKFSNQSLNSTYTSNSLGISFNTAPILPDRRTSITDNLAVLQTNSPTTHFSDVTMNGNLQLNSQVTRLINTSLGYQYTHDPQLAAQVPVVNGTKLIGLANATDKNNFTMSFGARTPDDRWDLSLNSSYGLPTQDVTAGGSLLFRISSQMHFQIDNYYSELAGYGYQDTDFSISHRIGARDLVISWDSLAHAFRFNIAQAQF
jgi:hypothetical protein